MKSIFNYCKRIFSAAEGSDTLWCLIHILQWPLIFVAAAGLYVCAVARSLVFLLILRPELACRELEHIIPDDL